MSGRPGKDQSKAPDFARICVNLTSASKKFSAADPTHSSACINVAQRRDNQMAIAKKTPEMLLPTLRIHREHLLARTRSRLNDVAE